MSLYAVSVTNQKAKCKIILPDKSHPSNRQSMDRTALNDSINHNETYNTR